mgnify:CR=1 FL=1
MRAVVQRTTEASVTVEGKIVGEIGRGLVVFLGIEEGDTQSDMTYICDKVTGLRVFDDENEIPNLSVADIGGSVLLVSQFTLCADARKGKRPSYIKAARPESAIPLYEAALTHIAKTVPFQHGVFQANMQVRLVNDGPHTILLDSKKVF